jgi:dTDP-4-dehydrorhamnose 3,5-epimerase-like enzyme
MIVKDALRDQPGPNHEPLFLKTKINDVVLMKSPSVEYLGDSLLTELYRPEWHGLFESGEEVQHLYTIKAPSGGIRKEWYFHEHTLDRYMLLSGALDVGLYDGREESETFGVFEIVSLEEPGGNLPNAIRIPPLVWHSLIWKSSSGMFLNAKLPGYNSKVPDKFRVSLEDLPDVIEWRY